MATNLADFAVDAIAAPPGDGKAEISATPPAAEQVIAQPKQDAQQPPTPPAEKTPEQVEAERRAASKDDLLGSFKPKRTEAEELEITRRELAASSKAGRWNNEVVKALAAVLEAQGVKLDVAEQENEKNEKTPAIRLTPTREYGKEAGKFKIVFADLPDEAQRLAIDEPQKFVDMLMDKARAAYVRVQATAEKPPVRVSDERLNAELDKLAERMPEAKVNRDIIRELITRPNALRASVLDALHDDPANVLEMLHLKLERAFSDMEARRKKVEQAENEKKKLAEQARGTLPTGAAGAMTADGSAGGRAGGRLAAYAL